MKALFFYKKDTKISQISLVFDKIQQYDVYCRNIYPILNLLFYQTYIEHRQVKINGI